MVKNRDFSCPLYFSTPPLARGGSPSEYCYAIWYGKSRMAWLPDGEKILICLFVLTFDTTHERVRHTHTHTHTHTQTPHDGKARKKSTLHPDDVSSPYRPISNLPYISKFIERVVVSRLSYHTSTFNLLPAQQSAYRSFHSTETAPLVHRQRPRLCHRQWKNFTICTIRSQCGFRQRRSPDTAVGIRKPVFHGLHRSPLV